MPLHPFPLKNGGTREVGGGLHQQPYSRGCQRHGRGEDLGWHCGRVQLNGSDSSGIGVGKMPCVGVGRSGRGCMVAGNIQRKRS